MRRSLLVLGAVWAAASASACGEGETGTHAAPESARSTDRDTETVAGDSGGRGPEERPGTDRGDERDRAERPGGHRAGAATTHRDAEPASLGERLFERATKSDRPPSLEQISRQLEGGLGSEPASAAD